MRPSKKISEGINIDRHSSSHAHLQQRLRHHSGFRHLWKLWGWYEVIFQVAGHGSGPKESPLQGFMVCCCRCCGKSISGCLRAVTSWGCLQLSLVTGCWCMGGPTAGFLHMGKKLIFFPNHVRFYRTSILDIYCPLSLRQFHWDFHKTKTKWPRLCSNWGAWGSIPCVMNQIPHVTTNSSHAATKKKQKQTKKHKKTPLEQFQIISVLEEWAQRILDSNVNISVSNIF